MQITFANKTCCKHSYKEAIAIEGLKAAGLPNANIVSRAKHDKRLHDG